MIRKHYIGICVAAAGFVASPVWASHELQVSMLPSPASDASMTPHFTSDGDELYMSWLEVTADGHALRVARLGKDGFDEPRTVRASNRFFANWVAEMRAARRPRAVAKAS